MMTIAALCAGLPIAQAQAAMRGAASHAHRSASDTTTASPDSGVTVSQIHGQAFRIKTGGAYVALRPGSNLAPGEPVGVGGKSRMDLRVRDDGVLELGPGARLLVPPGADGGRSKAATALRLEQGYLRVRLTGEQARAARMEVSFGRWSASMEPGEYVLDAREPESSICTVSGMLHLSEGPEGAPASVSSGCLLLGAQAPATVTLGPADWKRVQARRALQPVVAEVNWREVKDALARVEADYAGKANRKSPAAVTAATPTDDDAPSPVRIETHDEVASIPEPLQRMPRTRASAMSVPRPVSLAPLEAMVRRVERQVAREQARLAEALVASAGPIPASGVVETPPAAATRARTDAPAPTVVAVEDSHERPSPSHDGAVPTRVEANPLPAAAPPSDVHATAAVPSPRSAAPAPLPTAPPPNLQLALDAGLATLKSDPSVGPTTFTSQGDARALVSEPIHTPSEAREAIAARPVEVNVSPASPPAAQSEAAAHANTLIANAPGKPVSAPSPSDPLAHAQSGGQATPPLEWIVNVASFPSLESAERQAEQLRAQKLATGIRSETVRGRSAYRVVIEGLATEEAANTVLRELVSRLGLRQAWAFRKS